MGLCKTTEESKQLLDARRLYFGGRQCRKLTFVDDVAGSLTSEYFDLNVITEDYTEKKYYVLMEGDSSATDPAPAGKTKLTLSYTDGATKETLAGLFQTLVDGLADSENVRTLIEAETPECVEYQNGFLGLVTTEDFANAPSLTASIEAEGFGGFLGALAEGGSTLTTEVEFIEVRADDTGGTLLDKIIRSLSGQVTAPLVEMTGDNWKSLVGKGAGSIYTSGSDEFVGYGTAQVYQSAFAKSGQLTMHPVRLANSDRTEDITIWKTMPVLSDINFSGSEIQTANLTFDGLRDSSKPSEIDIWARGDHSKI